MPSPRSSSLMRTSLMPPTASTMRSFPSPETLYTSLEARGSVGLRGYRFHPLRSREGNKSTHPAPPPAVEGASEHPQKATTASISATCLIKDLQQIREKL